MLGLNVADLLSGLHVFYNGLKEYDHGVQNTGSPDNPEDEVEEPDDWPSNDSTDVSDDESDGSNDSWAFKRQRALAEFEIRSFFYNMAQRGRNPVEVQDGLVNDVKGCLERHLGFNIASAIENVVVTGQPLHINPGLRDLSKTVDSITAINKSMENENEAVSSENGTIGLSQAHNTDQSDETRQSLINLYKHLRAERQSSGCSHEIMLQTTGFEAINPLDENVKIILEMTSHMRSTFHLAPRFTINPPPEGPLHLGTIVDDLTNVEPINETCRCPLPGEEYKHTTEGFVATRSMLRTGKFGVWAKFVIEGMGGELSLSGDRDAEDVFRFEKLEEITFTATRDYMTQSMNEPAVKEFVEGGGWDPVYMITGLKIARGPAITSKRSQKMAIKANLGLSQPNMIPGLEIGPDVEYTSQSSESGEFKKSDDFIYGIRVKRLYFKRKFLSRKPGAVIGEHFHRGATLVDNDASAVRENVEEVGAEDIDVGEEEMEDRDQVMDGEEIWVIPSCQA